MATNTVEDFLIELDINEDIPIEIESYSGYDDFESTEVEFPDDLLLEEFDDETLKLLDSAISEIPSPLAFAPVTTSTFNTTPGSSNETEDVVQTSLKCTKRNKIYKKEKNS